MQLINCVVQVFEFNVEYPDVAILTFEVFDEDVTRREFVGTCSVPVSQLRMGFRSCHLYNHRYLDDGDFAFAVLTVRICEEQM